jgi:hypothetical protein
MSAAVPRRAPAATKTILVHFDFIRQKYMDIAMWRRKKITSQERTPLGGAWPLPLPTAKENMGSVSHFVRQAPV